MTLFTLKLTVGVENFDIDYNTLDECLGDKSLAAMLDGGRGANTVSCILWVGKQRLSGKPIITAEQLRERIVANSHTLMRQVLPRGGR